MLNSELGKLVEKGLLELDFQDTFLVDIKVRNNKIEIFLDSDDAVSFLKCQKLSRWLEAILDENKSFGENYTLEVSSAGVGSPLRLLRQYPKTIGRNIDVSYGDGENTASPETRKQGDFRMGYEWDNAVVNFGGGLSHENDYKSSYGNVNGRFDFNQKLTSLKWGGAYTTSATSAILDHDTLSYVTPLAYNGQIDFQDRLRILRGSRQDWTANIGLTQVLGKSSLIDANIGYTIAVVLWKIPIRPLPLSLSILIPLAQTPLTPFAAMCEPC